MMIQKLKTIYVNYRPPYLKEKYVVLESDDWGSIRTSSVKAVEALRKMGSPVDRSPYARIDALECDDDLLALYDVLGKHRGSDGKPAKFTFNNIMGNPDFDRIRESGYSQYHWEPFERTLQRYPAHGQVMQLYRQGMAAGLVQVQFHGKDHVNVDRWMKDLREDAGLARKALELGVFSFPFHEPPRKFWNEYMDAFGMDHMDELESKRKVLREGLEIFRQFWGFRSRSVIAPCYVWHSSLEKEMAAAGVDTIQGITYQFEPAEGSEQVQKYHYLGQKNAYGMQYFVRNASFEPFVDNAPDWEKRCLDKISMAFMFRKPAIISTHRANFAGFLDPANRKTNLARLDTLLAEILKRWPEVRFVSTDELAEITLN